MLGKTRVVNRRTRGSFMTLIEGPCIPLKKLAAMSHAHTNCFCIRILGEDAAPMQVNRVAFQNTSIHRGFVAFLESNKIVVLERAARDEE